MTKGQNDKTFGNFFISINLGGFWSILLYIGYTTDAVYNTCNIHGFDSTLPTLGYMAWGFVGEDLTPEGLDENYVLCLYNMVKW